MTILIDLMTSLLKECKSAIHEWKEAENNETYALDLPRNAFFHSSLRRAVSKLRVFTAAMTEEWEHFRNISWMLHKISYYGCSSVFRDVSKCTVPNRRWC